MRDPLLLAECRALRAVLERHPTLAALRAAPDWPRLKARLDAVLGTVRRHPAPEPPAPPADPARVRAVQWNVEHGNAYPAIEAALHGHPELAGADLLLLEETDLGMARSGNRDVGAELGCALGLHVAFAPLFLETTRGRDDDRRRAGGRENEEGLFGLSILSRWPIGETRLVALPSPERIQFERQRMFGRHVALLATIERPGAPFVAAATHLEVHRSRAHRTAQARLVADALAGETRPVVLAGDFNSHTFDRGTWSAPLAGALTLWLTPADTLQRRLLQPDRGAAHEPLFDELARAGFAWERCNDREPTLQLRFDRLEELHALFGPATGGVRWLLRRGESRGRLRLDWFLVRGWREARGHTVRGLDGTGGASDHAPIVAELA
jgi:endonuclease/exonuclease/phosphatase family metal-dependent hydrolase